MKNWMDLKKKMYLLAQVQIASLCYNSVYVNISYGLYCNPYIVPVMAVPDPDFLFHGDWWGMISPR